jgi:hypothetical protein
MATMKHRCSTRLSAFATTPNTPARRFHLRGIGPAAIACPRIGTEQESVHMELTFAQPQTDASTEFAMKWPPIVPVRHVMPWLAAERPRSAYVARDGSPA